jgi:hypothetical protein
MIIYAPYNFAEVNDRTGYGVFTSINFAEVNDSTLYGGLQLYLHLLEPLLGDPHHGRVRQDISFCILTSVHWTPDYWQSSIGQDVPTDCKYQYIYKSSLI